jgi:casein kinase I family protein HRR25
MEIINKKYKIINKIGEGAYGLIYKGQNIRTNEYVAIKIEPIENELKLLKNESKIYQYLNNNEGIPNVKWFGKDNINYYMVINLLGHSLQTIKNKYNKFSLKLILQIGIQIINILKTIHSNGLVHRDIKPDNFLFGLNNESKLIYIIDFGFCKTYIKDEKHISQKQTKNLIGSYTYASINAHNFIELSRRDDLESLGYLLLYFYFGTLPWQNILLSEENSNDRIKYLKIQIIENNNLPNVLINYMKYMRKLSFEEKPNYELIIDTFKSEIELLTKNS